MLLRENTTLAIRQIARVKPHVFEADQEKRKLLLSRYDSLRRSLHFFMHGDEKTGIQYRNPDRAACIMNILAEMDEIKTRGKEIPATKTIGQLAKENADVCEDNIVLILNDLRLVFQVDNVISNEGLYSLAYIITSEYTSLTLEELAICMNLAKLGHFGKDGKVYNRLDAPIILGWLKQYVLEKQNRINERNYTAESHNRIGQEDGRGNSYLYNRSQLLEAQVFVFKEKSIKGK